MLAEPARTSTRRLSPGCEQSSCAKMYLSMSTSSLRKGAKPFRSRPLALWLLSAGLVSVGCVDLTKPWDKVVAQGGIGGGKGGAGGQILDAAADGTGGAGGAIDTGGLEVGGGLGGIDAIDAPLTGTGGAIDAPFSGAGGAIDAPLSGAGGAIDTGTQVGSGGVLGSGGVGSDAQLGDGGGKDGGAEVARPGTGGTTGTGGATGKGGTTGTGGSTGTGGATGTGGVVGTGGVIGTGGVVGTGGVPGTGGADPLLVGLLAYYPCDSATGTTLPDKSGNGNNGTLSAASISFATPGKVGTGALILAKANSDFVTMPAAMFNGVTDITIATWVKVVTAAQPWPRIFDIGINAKVALNPSTGTNTYTYMNLVPQNESSPPNLVFAITKSGFPGEQQLTNPTPSTGVWQHLAIVLSAGSGSLYVNGALPSPSKPVALRPADLGTIDYAFIGKCQFSHDPFFDGQIDDFRVYNRALSASEIDALSKFTGP